MLNKTVIKSDADDHIWITIECPDRPVISIDIMNLHGRRSLDVRVDGMGMFGCLLDVKELPPSSGDLLHRYCSMCGEKLNLYSSRPHVCPNENG
jgi:hypothetical protein